MDYIFPPTTVGVLVAPPALMPAAASGVDAQHTLSMSSVRYADGDALNAFDDGGAAASTATTTVSPRRADWRPLMRLTVGLEDLYSFIDTRDTLHHHHRNSNTGTFADTSTNIAASGEGHSWYGHRPPTPSLSSSGCPSTPSAASGTSKHAIGTSRSDAPPSLPYQPQQQQHRDPMAGLITRVTSQSSMTSAGLHGTIVSPMSGSGNTTTVNPVFVTAMPRVLTEPSDLVAKMHSDGFLYEVDNTNGDLVLFVGMVLCDRYEVLKLLGAGTFGQVAMCRDHYAVQHNAELHHGGGCTHSGAGVNFESMSFMASASLSKRNSLRFPKQRELQQHSSFGVPKGPSAKPMPELVAVKVIKSDAAYERQSALEVNIVRDMAARFPNDPRLELVVHNFGHGYSFGHYCLVFELLGVNLFDVLSANQYRGMELSAVREVAQQLLMAVSLCHDCGITHSDIKPENILLARPQAEDIEQATDAQAATGSIRLIDFGAAFRSGHCPFTYIQSRYYRAPEVILDCDLTDRIDLWSVGCVLAELFLGLPLLPGGDDFQQLELMQEMLGAFPSVFATKGRVAAEYFCVETPASPHPTTAQPQLGSGSTTASPFLLNRTMTNSFDSFSHSSDSTTTVSCRLRTADQFYCLHPTSPRPEPQPKYFNYASVVELVDNYPLSQRERDWAVEAQARLCPQGSTGSFAQPVIDAILGVRRRFSAFIVSLLQLNPALRPSAAEALKDPFFTFDLPNLDRFGEA